MRVRPTRTTTQLETIHLSPQPPLHPVLNPPKPVLNPPLNLVVPNPPLDLVLSLALNPILSDESRQHLVLVDFPVERYQLNRMALVLPSFR